MSDCSTEFFCKWQTLISGILALVAAVWTVCVLKRQINLSERHERTRRETSEAAARAVLPLTLSAIINYARQSSNTLYALYKNREGEVITERMQTIELPPIPESAIGSLQSMIEASTNQAVVKVIAKIIGKIQIQNSRIRSVVHEEQAVRPNHVSLVTARNIEDYIIDSAIIFAFAESLFDYARLQSETPEEVKWSNVSRALCRLDWDEHNYAPLHQTVARMSASAALIE